MFYAVTLIASIICFAIGVLLALVIRSIKKDESGLSFQQIKESLLLFVFGGGFVGFIAGFLGPLIFAPEANQGPLLGIFFTGPLGAVGGLIAFMIYVITRKGPEGSP